MSWGRMGQTGIHDVEHDAVRAGEGGTLGVMGPVLGDFNVEPRLAAGNGYVFHCGRGPDTAARRVALPPLPRDGKRWPAREKKSRR